MQRESRVCAPSCLRVETSDGKPRIRGTAIVYNSRSELVEGRFKEIIAPGAVTNADADIRALVDHDTSKVLGRTTVGTMKLEDTAEGLQVTIDPPDTSYARDLIESIRRGDVSGMSFGFQVTEDEWDMEGDTPVRTVRKLVLYEVSCVTFPAYPDTELAIRSLRAWSEQRLAETVEHMQRYIDLYFVE